MRGLLLPCPAALALPRALSHGSRSSSCSGLGLISRRLPPVSLRRWYPEKDGRNNLLVLALPLHIIRLHGN